MIKYALLLVVLLSNLAVFGQIESTTYNGKNYYVYPFQQEVRSNERFYYQFADQKEILKRDDKNRKVVEITYEAISKVEKQMSIFGKLSKKEEKRILEMLKDDPSSMCEVENSLLKDITPTLEPLPDGEYIQYYRDIPYVENKIIRYRNDVVAGTFTIKNNNLNGSSTWYHPDGKLARIGEYLNGMKQNSWKQFDYEENFLLSFLEEKDNYSEMNSKIIYDTTINNMSFKNGVRHGSYSRYINQQLINSGEYTDDKESGTWKLFGLKEIKKQNEKGEWIIESDDNEYILLENFTYRSDKKRGKSLMLRSEVIHSQYRYGSNKKLFFEDTLFSYYERQSFPNFRYFYSLTEKEDDMELPEEFYESYEGSEDLGYSDYYGEDHLFNNFLDSTYSQFDQYETIDGKRYRINQLIDSLGYIYNFDGIYEMYYQNGQLKYKLEIVDGKLVNETPVYWDNGNKANEVVFISDSNRFEQRYYDYYGYNYLTVKYQPNGIVIKEKVRESSETFTLNGKEYYKNFGRPNFNFENYEGLKKGLTSRELILEKRWKEDSIVAATAYFDPVSKTLETTENNFAGELYSKSEVIFSDDYSSLTSSKSLFYKNVTVDVVASGTYEDMYRFDFISLKSEDSISPQTRALSWQYRYKVDSDLLLKVDNVPFTGKYSNKLESNKFSVKANSKSINIITPTDYSDEKIYKKEINRYKKTKKPSDFVRAYFPDYGGADNVSTGVYSMFEFDGSIRSYNTNNYYLDTCFIDEQESYEDEGYMMEGDYIDDSKKRRKPAKNKYARAIASTGQYLNGKKEGLWITKDQKGKTLSEFHYKQGELHGQLNIYKVEYPMKKRDKEFEDYDYDLPVYLREVKPKKKTYFLERTATFNNGKIIGPLYRFNWQGDTLEREFYVDGIQSGITFKRNKLFYTEINYEDGYQDGITRTYLTEPGKDSVLLFELNFQNGSLQGKSVAYHANGNIAKKGFFLNGLPIDDFEAYDTLGFKYQYVKFKYNQPIEEKIWEENQLSIKYEFDWRDSIPFRTDDVTTATSIENLLYEMGFDDGSMRRPYYGRPSLVDKSGITYTLTKYYPNDTIARKGMIEKGKKVGCWEYFSYDGLKLMEVEYFDTLFTKFDSIKFKSKGVLTYVDSNGTELSKSYIIEKIEKYDCSHSDHHEERMLYCFWEKDTNQHRMNGYVKNRYDNGALQNEGYVKDGIPVGIWKLYDSNGNLNQVGIYKNGKRDGRWIKGDLGSVKNMSEICLNPNLENLEEILNYEEKLLDISVIYYNLGKEIRREYYGINMNNEKAPDGYYEEDEYYEEMYYEEGY